MIRYKTLGLCGVLCLLACFSVQASGETSKEIFPQGAVVLPRFFDGLTWKYDAAAIKRRLPHSSVETQAGDGNHPTLSIYTGAKLPYFGQAMVNVFYDQQGNILFYEITTNELRVEACAPENESRPKNCRNRFGPALIKIRNELLRQIQAKLGKGKAIPECDPSSTVGACHNYSYNWPVGKDAQLSIAIYQDDGGWWFVDLYVGRNAAEHLK